jgi:Ankyrin repeats (3 copies)
MSSPKKKSKKSEETDVAKLVTHAVYVQISSGNEDDAVATINGNVGILDFSSVHGMYKDTLLTAALSEGLERVALKILELSEIVKGINIQVEHRNSLGDYPFLLACKRGFLRCARLILRKGTTLCETDNDGFTPLMYASARHEMLPLVEFIVNHNDRHNICDIGFANENGRTALSTAYEVGNPYIANVLLHSGKSNPGTILKEHDDTTLLMYILSNPNGIRDASYIVETTGMDCNPLYIHKDKLTALQFAMPMDPEDFNKKNITEHVDLIRMLLSFAEQEKAFEFVDAHPFSRNQAAFDTLFLASDFHNIPVNEDILKLFIDFYYKNNPNSEVFLRNVDKICANPVTMNAVRKMYPGKKNKKILKHLCRDVVETQVSLKHPLLSQPTLPTGKRLSMIPLSENYPEAEEIVTAEDAVEESPLDTGFQVGDPGERGIRQTKRLPGGKKRKTHKQKPRKTI